MPLFSKKKKKFDGVSFIKGRIRLLIPNVYTGCMLGPLCLKCVQLILKILKTCTIGPYGNF